MIVYILLLLIIAVIAYGMGSMSSIIIADSLLFGKQLRRLGKGDTWLSNFYRVYRVKGFIKLLLVECVKDAVPILIGGLLLSMKGHAEVGRAFAGFCLVLGRLYPVFFRFKGSVGSICMIMAGLMVDAPIGIVVAIVIAGITVFTRYLSLGAVAGAVALIAVSLFVLEESLTISLMLFIAGLMVFRHIPSIARLISGTEKRLSFKKDLSYKFDEKF